MKVLVKLLCLLTFLAGELYSQPTEVPPNISGSQTWTKAGSPYNVRQYTVIEENATLIIEPGVSIQFFNSDGIDVFGKVNINGAKSDSVRFINRFPIFGVNTLNMFNLKKKATFTLQYGKIENASTFINCMGIDSFAISHSFFRDCVFPIYGDMCFVSLENNIFEKSTEAVVRKQVYIKDCRFTNSRNALKDVTGKIQDSEFKGGDYGLLGSNDIEISGCTFEDFRLAAIRVNSESNPSLIENNTISGNSIGLSLHGNQSDSLIVRGNSFCNNLPWNVENKTTYNFDLSNNCWCDTSTSNIDSSISNTSGGQVRIIPLHISCRPCIAFAGPDITTCSERDFSIGNPANTNIDTNNIPDFQWIPADGLNDPDNEFTFGNLRNNTSDTLSRLYILQVSGNTSCYDTVMVYVLPYSDLSCKPCMAYAGTDTDVCSGSSASIGIELQEDFFSYLWLPDEGLSANNVSNPVFSFSNPTSEIISKKYILQISDPDSICIASDTIIVNVLPEFSQLCKPRPPIHVYNVITVNNDGKNETFTIDNIEYYPVHSVTILNRWGEIVFKSNSYTNTWDGESLPEGNYYYVVSVPEINLEAKGSLLIKR